MTTECPHCHSRLVTTKVAVDGLSHGAVAIGVLLIDKAIAQAQTTGSSASWLRSAVVMPTAAAALKHLSSKGSEPHTDPNKQLRCWRCQHTFRSDD